MNDYYLAITAIEAQEALVAMDVCAYPHMKKASMKEFRRNITKLAWSHEKKNTKPNPVEDAVRILQKLHGSRRKDKTRSQD